LIEIHLVEVAHACEHNAVAEFANIVEMLLEDRWICLFRDLVGFVFRKSWELALE
jgi:hypothetical protein